MPSAEGYLKIQETDQDWVKVQIDPATVSGQKGVFGQRLFLPYTLSNPERTRSVTMRLLSLEGWIGWSGEEDFVAKLRIPSQIVSNNRNKQGFHVPITDAQIEAIEEARKGNNASLTVSLGGLATIITSSADTDRIGSLTPIESSYSSNLTI